MWIQKTISSQTDRSPHFVQAHRATLAGTEGSEAMELADEPEEGGVQPDLQPQDVRLWPGMPRGGIDRSWACAVARNSADSGRRFAPMITNRHLARHFARTCPSRRRRVGACGEEGGAGEGGRRPWHC